MSHCKADLKRWNAVITFIFDSSDHLPLDNYDVFWGLGMNLMMLSQLTCHLFYFKVLFFFSFTSGLKPLLSTTLSAIYQFTTESLLAHKMRRHIFKLCHLYLCSLSCSFLLCSHDSVTPKLKLPAAVAPLPTPGLMKWPQQPFSHWAAEWKKSVVLLCVWSCL